MLFILIIIEDRPREYAIFLTTTFESELLFITTEKERFSASFGEKSIESIETPFEIRVSGKI